MASEPQRRSRQIRRIPLTRSRRRLSFERRLRLWLMLMSLPVLVLCAFVLDSQNADTTISWIVLLIVAAGLAFAVSLIVEQITRPLQTLANVVAALREDDYSFRARGAQRNDAMGDLALEINALASMLQAQRAGALEAMALVERVMSSMQSPVLAFDPDDMLVLLNAAAQRVLGIEPNKAIGRSAKELKITYLVEADDEELLSLGAGQQATRWMLKRTDFRLRGVPHTLVVLADVSAALREEERTAFERLIRVMGHEINNSLAPIKSIAESLRGRIRSTVQGEQGEDFERGLEVIESRAESLNRFLQAYRQLMGLPAPRLEQVSLATLVSRVARLETRVEVTVASGADLTVSADPDQIQQALINLLRNAAEAALSPDAATERAPSVTIGWEREGDEVAIAITDNGPGLTNPGNLFVPFYTTKPTGTGIGLVLAQQIAQAHRGAVELRNRTDGISGCRAELRLPLNGPA